MGKDSDERVEALAGSVAEAGFFAAADLMHELADVGDRVLEIAAKHGGVGIWAEDVDCALTYIDSCLEAWKAPTGSPERAG